MRKVGMIILTMFLAVIGATMSLAQETDSTEVRQDAIGRTPPRLSYAQGQVSFWRPGADEWVQAQINTALAPGDQLFAGADGNMELQIGPRAFVRGGANAQIGLESQEPDFVQFKVTSGSVAIDMRTVEPGRMVEVDTPNAAFTIDAEGYYRLDVGDEGTQFSVRRAGRATATSGNGDAISIGANEMVVIEGTAPARIASQTAAPLDEWDRWNYGRTDRFLEAAESANYISPQTYGLSELDHYGTWRIVPTYGAVWMPRGVAAGWVPYSTGAWMRDPYYGWTWVDTAPWGWAPYHYGRWVHVNSYWCWAPGPRVIRPVYAPALVAFYGQPDVHVGVNIGFGGPSVGWVSLGWGEPLLPWWGVAGFIHTPWWGGWGGPCIVNNVVVRHRTAVHARDINFYRNTRVRNAMVVVGRDHFGRGPITHDRIQHADNRHLRPMHAAPHLDTRPANFVPTTHRGPRPPERHLKQPVVRFPSRHNAPNQGPAGESHGVDRQKVNPMMQRMETTPRPHGSDSNRPPAAGQGSADRNVPDHFRKRPVQVRKDTSTHDQHPSKERPLTFPAPSKPAQPLPAREPRIHQAPSAQPPAPPDNSGRRIEQQPDAQQSGVRPSSNDSRQSPRMTRPQDTTPPQPAQPPTTPRVEGPRQIEQRPFAPPPARQQQPERTRPSVEGNAASPPAPNGRFESTPRSSPSGQAESIPRVESGQGRTRAYERNERREMGNFNGQERSGAPAQSGSSRRSRE